MSCFYFRKNFSLLIYYTVCEENKVDIVFLMCGHLVKSVPKIQQCVPYVNV